MYLYALNVRAHMCERVLNWGLLIFYIHLSSSFDFLRFFTCSLCTLVEIAAIKYRIIHRVLSICVRGYYVAIQSRYF